MNQEEEAQPNSITVEAETAADSSENTSKKALNFLFAVGGKIFAGMEYVGQKSFQKKLNPILIQLILGEMVADAIGLDDSKFQDVIDSMTEEEWRVAVQVINS